MACGVNNSCLEDLVPGAVYEFGGTEVTEASIIDFAKQFDPQSFHVDLAAESAPFIRAACGTILYRRSSTVGALALLNARRWR